MVGGVRWLLFGQAERRPAKRYCKDTPAEIYLGSIIPALDRKPARPDEETNKQEHIGLFVGGSVCTASGLRDRRRKTFSGNNGKRGGRPRKDGPRDAAGRLKRLSEAELARAIQATVIAQPHRRGSDDPRRHWPIGRLILDGKVGHSSLSADVLERAAQRYASDYARLQRALASRRPLAVTGGKVLRPEDIEAEQKESDAARKAWADVSRELRHAGGERVEKACQFAILDALPDMAEDTLAAWVVLSLPLGLKVLSDFYRLSDGK